MGRLPPGRPALTIPFSTRFSESQWRAITAAADALATTPSELIRSAAVDLAAAHADAVARMAPEAVRQ